MQQLNITSTMTNDFPRMFQLYITSLLREIVYIHILKGIESDFVDLTSFGRLHKITMSTVGTICAVIQEELHTNGWKTKLSFGDTGLFIFIENQPTNCW